MLTENGTYIRISSHDWVEIEMNDSQITEDCGFFSFTPQEARKIADALLNASQSVEDRMPHGNC